MGNAHLSDNVNVGLGFAFRKKLQCKYGKNFTRLIEFPLVTGIAWNDGCALNSEIIAVLTHWGRVTHICASRLTIAGSDNGLSPGRRQAIIWTNAGILLIGPLGTNFSENLIEILTFSFTKMRLKVSSAKWRSFCLGLNVLNRDAELATVHYNKNGDLGYSFKSAS